MEGWSGGRRFRGLVVGFAESDDGERGAGGRLRRELATGDDVPGVPVPAVLLPRACGIPRADAKLVAREDVDFWRRAG